MTTFVSPQLTGHPVKADPAFASILTRKRIEDAEDQRITGRPSSSTLQLRHSKFELNFVANVSEFWDKNRREMLWVVYGIRRWPFSAHIVAVYGSSGFYRSADELKCLRPGKEPGLPPEIATRKAPKDYGQCLEAILEYIGTHLAQTRPYRANVWL